MILQPAALLTGRKMASLLPRFCHSTTYPRRNVQQKRREVGML